MLKNISFFLSIIFSTFTLAIDLSQLSMDKGFNIAIFAEGLDAPRQMAEGKNGVIYVGERGGKIVALSDTDGNGVADSRVIVADFRKIQISIMKAHACCKRKIFGYEFF